MYEQLNGTQHSGRKEIDSPESSTPTFPLLFNWHTKSRISRDFLCFHFCRTYFAGLVGMLGSP